MTLLKQLLFFINFKQYKIGILCFITAFVAAMILMPPLIKFITRFKLYDVPDLRKVHQAPVPTMGGIAVCLGMAVACALWFSFTYNYVVIAFFFSLAVLFAIGIMDDLYDMPAYYKFAIQLGVALLVTFAGVRITSFNGMLGINTLPVVVQYLFTTIVIVGITNAFNLIDGIDGLAGGLGFMSLCTLGIFLTLSNEANMGIVAFALAGSLLGFLYYNFNPARIFMGDTGSLILGFTVGVLCVHLIQVNMGQATSFLPHAPVFGLSIVLIPVFDTLRVFTLRAARGKSPFDPDRTHIHHLLTNQGWSHSFTAKLICTLHGAIMLLGYFVHNLRQEVGLLLLLGTMLAAVTVFKKLQLPAKQNKVLQPD